MLNTDLNGASCIERVGRTAVGGLAAKPIIDVMVGLKDFSIADGNL